MVDPNNALALAELARIQAYSSRLLSNDTGWTWSPAPRSRVCGPGDGQVLAIQGFVLDWNADPNFDSLQDGGSQLPKLLIEADQEALRSISRNGGTRWRWPIMRRS